MPLLHQALLLAKLLFTYFFRVTEYSSTDAGAAFNLAEKGDKRGPWATIDAQESISNSPSRTCGVDLRAFLDMSPNSRRIFAGTVLRVYPYTIGSNWLTLLSCYGMELRSQRQDIPGIWKRSL